MGATAFPPPCSTRSFDRAKTISVSPAIPPPTICRYWLAENASTAAISPTSSAWRPGASPPSRAKPLKRARSRPPSGPTPPWPGATRLHRWGSPSSHPQYVRHRYAHIAPPCSCPALTPVKLYRPARPLSRSGDYPCAPRDVYGNAQIDGITISDLSWPGRQKADHLHRKTGSESAIRQRPESTGIPTWSMRSSDPLRAYPANMAYEYFSDEEHLGRWLEERDEEQFRSFTENIYDVDNHWEYIT